MTDTITMPREVAERILRNIEIGNKLSAGIELRREVEAAQEQQKDQPEQHLETVPPGWKLVPVEPTEKMLSCIRDHVKDYPGWWGHAYRDLVEAAPQPPAVEQPQSVTDCHQTQPQGEQATDGVRFDLYTHPQPKREPLTDKELNLIASRWHLHLLEGQDKQDLFEFARAIESYSASAKLTQLTNEQISAIVANHCLNVGDWSKNGASVARAIERAHKIGGAA